MTGIYLVVVHSSLEGGKNQDSTGYLGIFKRPKTIHITIDVD